jgi:BirA family transcriptional regulator, biotin operon repressor / biotin---[acetyl-CoA-carboxylase] ligase
VIKPWPVEALWEDIVPEWPGFTVEVLGQTDSTNSELMRRARAGQCEPILLVAESQTAGRGRLGRSWVSHGDDSAEIATLTFSLGVPLQGADWSGLSLAIGVSVASSLHASLKLKWPNDLWLGQCKMAGILVETASCGAIRYAVIGIGLNITARVANGLTTPPAWLQQLLPECDAPQALLQLAAPLARAIRSFESQGLKPFQQEFARRDALKGLDVEVSDGTSGMADGIDDKGALLVHTATGLKKIFSSEVSVRPKL